MPACVAFGPNDSFFFNSPNKWSWGGLPTAVNALFTGQNKAKDVFDMALGPSGSFCVAYQDASGKRLLRSGLPAGLDKWLVPRNNTCARDIESLCVALGPNNSYFAIDKNGSAWGNLPPQLNAAVEARLDKKGHFKNGEGPRDVSLGPDGSFIYTSKGGGGTWNLKGQSDRLDQKLHSLKSLAAYGAILSPCRPGIYIAISSDGSCDATVPSEQFPKYEQFAQDFRQFVQAKAQVTARRQVNNNGASLTRNIIKGLGVVNSLLNAANGNNNGGGGGQTFFTNNSGGGGFDASSNFWAPIQSAASDPIQ